MNNNNELLDRILLNMKYDPKKSLNENKILILSEQSTNVGDYSVSYETEYNRIRIESPSGRTYYWHPSGKWYRIIYNLGNEQFVDLDPTKDVKTITTLSNVFKKSGIGASFYLRNTEQGNKFRGWVNSKYPEFAKSIDLSLKGPYNNSYIYKAWAKYGDQYKTVVTPKNNDLNRLKADLKSKGFDVFGTTTNQMYAYAALSATKKLNDRISRNIGGSKFTNHSVCVKKVGSTCPPGSYADFNTFNMEMAKKINSFTDNDPNSKNWKPTQYTFLTNFYFDWGKIMADFNNAFKLDPNAFKSELFPDGWWNWFTAYWGTDDFNSIQTHPEPQNVTVTSKNKYEKGYTMWSTEFLHDASSFVELGTLILGLIPSPLSPLLLGVSTGAGLADAGVYFAEGDKYMGSMMLALEIIPGGEFVKAFKKSKTISKLGKEGTKELLEKGAKKSLSESDEILFRQVKKEAKEIAPEIAEATQNQIIKNITENLPQNFLKIIKGMSPLNALKVFYNVLGTIWSSIGKVPQIMIKVGGTMWGIDQLYLAVFGRDEDRQNSDIRKLYYIIQGKGLPDQEELSRVVGEVEKNINPENVAKTITNDVVEQNDAVEWDKKNREMYIVRYNKNVNNKTAGYKGNEVNLLTPKIEDVINGSESISYGMSGPEISKIKSIIQSNWFADVDDNKLQKTMSNNVFDENLYEIITNFQLKTIPKYFKTEINPTKIGIIDKTTYNYLNQEPLTKLPTKKVDPYYLSKDKYDFYYYSSAQNK
jgi:uncharacterized protein YdhG (YjbR/CyaY superfamily)